jgi:uncharacterized linocin/CFP29 family protein
MATPIPHNQAITSVEDCTVERLTMAELNWTDAQWQKVKDAITEAFGKASVASSFLPMYGPLSGSAEIVRNDRLTQDASTPPILRLDADHDAVNVRLLNLTVRVELSSEQVADETLTNALLAFRRAANILAQEEDRIVFEGLRQQPQNLDSKFVLNDRVEPQEGLADLPKRRLFPGFDTAGISTGQGVITAVVNATQLLEDSFNPGPFTCVLGSELFTGVHDPSQSLVLPADRITPLLKGGPLLRATTIHPKVGIVVSPVGNAVDIVVGTPPTVQFLQRTQSARFLFRVYERFALRIRDADRPPVAGFRLRPTQPEIDFEEAQASVAEAERRNG